MRSLTRYRQLILPWTGSRISFVFALTLIGILFYLGYSSILEGQSRSMCLNLNWPNVDNKSETSLFSFSHHNRKKNSNALTEQDEFNSLVLKFFNQIGKHPGPLKLKDITKMILRLRASRRSTLKLDEYLGALSHRFAEKHREIQFRRNLSRKAGSNTRKWNGQQISLAVIACNSRIGQGIAMLKSATLFSQDAKLHVIAFGDNEKFTSLAEQLQVLRWEINAAGWDFTFELHLEWFPPEHAATWKKMFRECATQRLFFPSLLPHIDSMIYLDTDIIVMSNLTEMWNHIPLNMKPNKLAGMSPNNEPTADGWYNTMGHVPYYGDRGLNAGVMLMNLTQMRSFNIENRSIAVQTVYNEKMELADQDIYNIIFGAFPEKLHEMNCSYNFNWVHCGIPEKYPCFDEKTNKSKCFCRPVQDEGVKILHGNGHTFYSDMHKFMKNMYKMLEDFDPVTESLSDLMDQMKTNFTETAKTCRPLTEDMMFKNADVYIQNLAK